MKRRVPRGVLGTHVRSVEQQMLQVLHMAVTTSLRVHVHTCTHAQRKSLTVGSSCSSTSLTLDVRGDTDEQQPYPQFEPCQQKLEGHGVKD